MATKHIQANALSYLNVYMPNHMSRVLTDSLTHAYVMYENRFQTKIFVLMWATLRYKYIGQFSEVNLLGNSLKQFMGPFDVNCCTIFPTQFFGQLSDKIIIFNNFTKEFIVWTTLRFYLSYTHTYYSRLPRCI